MVGWPAPAVAHSPPVVCLPPSSHQSSFLKLALGVIYRVCDSFHPAELTPPRPLVPPVLRCAIRRWCRATASEAYGVPGHPLLPPLLSADQVWLGRGNTRRASCSPEGTKTARRYFRGEARPLATPDSLEASRRVQVRASTRASPAYRPATGRRLYLVHASK